MQIFHQSNITPVVNAEKTHIQSDCAKLIFLFQSASECHIVVVCPYRKW